MFSGDSPTSDSIRLLTAIGAYLNELSKSNKKAYEFCDSHFIRPKAMEEMIKMRSQLTLILKSTLHDREYPAIKSLSDGKLKPPTSRHNAVIRQIIFSAFPDHLAKLDPNVSKRVSSFGGKNCLPVYQSMQSGVSDILQIHPSSGLFRVRPPPEWIVFEQIVAKSELKTADNSGIIDRRSLLGLPSSSTPTQSKIRKLWLKGVSTVSEKWISQLSPRPLFQVGKILEQPEPRYMHDRDNVYGFTIPHIGPKLWTLDITETILTGTDGHAYFAKALFEGNVIGANGLTDPKKSIFALLSVF